MAEEVTFHLFAGTNQKPTGSKEKRKSLHTSAGARTRVFRNTESIHIKVHHTRAHTFFHRPRNTKNGHGSRPVPLRRGANLHTPVGTGSHLQEGTRKAQARPNQTSISHRSPTNRCTGPHISRSISSRRLATFCFASSRSCFINTYVNQAERACKDD